jgi:CoA-transferase family III
MSTRCTTRAGVALARRELDDLAARLGIALPPEARPGADLAVRARQGVPWPVPAPLVVAADGWVHPGPPTAWSAFVDMVTAMGAPWPRLDELTVDAIDREAAAWMLPAAGVRTAPAAPDPVPELTSVSVADASVVLLGTAWATPLIGRVLATLGAHVVKVEHPTRPDPFPLRTDLVRRQEVLALDLDVPVDRDRVAALVGAADLLVEGHPPRVLANAGIAPPRSGAVLRVAAFADEDRPGYGPAAEAHAGWAARHDPPRLGRTSVADPVAGMVGAVTAAGLLAEGASGSTARISLEGAVGRLLDRERHGG